MGLDYLNCESRIVDSFEDIVNYLVTKYDLKLEKNEARTKDGYDAYTKNSKLSFRYNQKGGLIKITNQNNSRIELYPCRGDHNIAATFDLSNDMAKHKNKSGAIWYDKTIKISEMIKIIDDYI